MPTRVEVPVDPEPPRAAAAAAAAIAADKAEEEEESAAQQKQPSAASKEKPKPKPKKKQLTLGSFFGKAASSQKKPATASNRSSSSSSSTKQPPKQQRTSSTTTSKTAATATAKAKATATLAAGETAAAYTSQANQLDTARRSEIASICLGKSRSRSNSPSESNSTASAIKVRLFNNNNNKDDSEHDSDRMDIADEPKQDGDAVAVAVAADGTLTQEDAHHGENTDEATGTSMMQEEDTTRGDREHNHDAEAMDVENLNESATTPTGNKVAASLVANQSTTESTASVEPSAQNSASKTSVIDEKGQQKDQQVKSFPHNAAATTNNTAAAAAAATAPSSSKHTAQKSKSASAAKTPKATVSSTAAPAMDSLDPPTLSEDAQQLLQKHANMRDTYRSRANELLVRVRAQLPEEAAFDIPTVAETVPEDFAVASASDEFPDFATRTLASLIEGRSDSLPALTTAAVAKLGTLYPTIPFSDDAVATKIKLLATRKNHVKQPGIALSDEPSAATPTNVFEDEQQDHFWRWEVAVLDLLPTHVTSQVKKARAAAKKLGAHFNAVAKLLATLHDADKLIRATTATPQKAKLDKLLARLSQEEEKVLKYERDAEKQRLVENAKAQKAAADQQKQAAAKAKKEEAEAAKKRKKEEQLEKKLAKEEADAKQRAKKEAAATKQKKMMSSFFSAPKAAKKAKLASSQEKPAVAASSQVTRGASAAAADDSVSTLAPSSFDVDAFRASLGGASTSRTVPPFASLSKKARQSRKRRTRQVSVPVTVTVYPDDHNPFGAQPYAELQDLTFPNKYKFLSFHEDVRPPYYGTWSKHSTFVTGRKPFAKDTAFLDYDVDSEAEWEEGDDEAGEDIGDDENEMDEEGDDGMAGGDDDDDGWLAGEVDEELDEETKLLRQKQLGSDDQAEALKVCVIAPAHGGKPLTRSVVTPDKIEGYTPEEAMAVLDSLTAVNVNRYPLYLDAFPPIVATAATKSSHEHPSSSENKSNGGKPSKENMRIFARFVHNSTLNSKDKVVDGLLQEHKTVTSSRSQALRVLDSIAEKKKKPTGTVWEVKKDVLDSLGLSELAESKCDAQQEAMKKIAIFVHHNTTSSKDKIVDDLRAHDESLTASRAEAARILQQIADKKKQPGTGYYWSVKKSVREDLDLEEVLSGDPPNPASAPDSKTQSTTKTPLLNSVSQSDGSTEATSSEKKSSSGKKRANLGSVQLLANFVKKKKTSN